MINRYPIWKYLLVLAVIVVGVIYALPNLYGDHPALQISAARDARVEEATETQVRQLLSANELQVKDSSLTGGRLQILFDDTETQLKAFDLVRDDLKADYNVALNLVPATPGWLKSLNALPMYLGLDLRGGVHFLLQVDMDAAIQQAIERYGDDIRSLLRSERIRYSNISREDQQLELRFRDAQERTKAYEVIHKEYRSLTLNEVERDGAFYLYGSLSEQEAREVKDFAVKQNTTTLRKRVNELGVAEPLIQRQGEDRIVVQLPGIQDPNEAKKILATTATLEYHMVDEEHSVEEALAGHVPPGSRLYRHRDGRAILLKKSVIVTGSQIIDASSGIDSQTGSPLVHVTLDSKGARKMGDVTKENIGKSMAVVFIETKNVTREVDGELKTVPERTEEVISVAVIRDYFSKRFQTTGLDSTEEARTLALLLRAGALAAPISIAEERTVGPSLGKDSIDKGTQSVIIGFVLVLAFMAVWYKGFGMVANLALAANLVLIVAVLSMLQATLTLPGIAGIVLTVGMAVDANVLIFERIREELRSGNTPHSSINAGYDKAFSTIADANITTLIAAVVLFSFGTGPIKGFAITLSIGILTSMFTAILGTRAVLNLVLGGRRISKLSI